MSMVKVEPSDLERKAAQLAAPLPAVPGLPLPADGLKIAQDGLSLLAASAQRLADQVAAGQTEAERLSQSFTAAAGAYRQVDDQASAALNNGAGARSMSAVAPFTSFTPRTAAPSGSGPGTRPSATFIKVEDAARALQESDHGASLTAFADAWTGYASQLEARAAAFTPSGVEWDSPAAARAFDALDQHHQWLLDLAESARKVASQAGILAAAHDNVLGAHPTLQEVLDVLNKIITDPDNREYWIELYQLLQRLCEELLEKYAKEADLEDVESPEAPSGTPQDSGGSGSGEDKKAEEPTTQEQQAGEEQPQQSESPSSGSGSPGGGSPGGGSQGSGSSGSGLPTGGLPTDTGLGEDLPGLPEDASTLPAAADAGGGAGGGGAGGGGGGLGATPLQQSVGGVGVSSSPASGGTPAAAAPAAAAGGGGMGGGMGMAPMHGAHGQGAKDRQRTPGTAPDEDLYVEDRPWTESVIGMPQGRRSGDGKGGK